MLAFDQSSDEIGWSVIAYRSADVLSGGSLKVRPSKYEYPNDCATDLVCTVLDGEWGPTALAVAFEDAFYAPPRKDDPKKRRGGWPTANALAELRGMCLREARKRGFRTVVVAPREWQGDHGWIGLPSEAVKQHSVRVARQLVPGLANDWVNEHVADAIHIGRHARGKLREEQWGKPQQELLP